MVIDRVSTNLIKKIIGKLSPDIAFSKSTVSRLTQKIDPQIKKWQKERLKEHYVYLFLMPVTSTQERINRWLKDLSLRLKE